MEEQRILSFNWNDYDTMHVVIQPAQMSPEELYAGFKRAYRETFRMHRIARTRGAHGHPLPDQLCRAISAIEFSCTVFTMSRALPRRISAANPGVPPPAANWLVPAELEEMLCCE